MKTLLASVVAAGALTLSLGLTSCQSTPKAALSEAEMMAKWTEYATPGDAHKVLAYKAGRWNLKVRMYMAPGAPAMESTGTSEMKWIMDGRYLQDDTTGVSNGAPFVGHGISGYDNFSHKYTSTWIDNMSTGVAKSEGTYDAATKTFNYTSSQPDFATGEYAAMRATEMKTDDDHWTMQAFCNDPEGHEYKCMEIEYTRAR